MDYVELRAEKEDSVSYKVSVSRKKIEGADGRENRIVLYLDFSFDQPLEKVTEDIMNEIGDTKDDTKSKMKEQILADLEREMKRMKGE